MENLIAEIKKYYQDFNENDHDWKWLQQQYEERYPYEYKPNKPKELAKFDISTASQQDIDGIMVIRNQYLDELNVYTSNKIIRENANLIQEYFEYQLRQSYPKLSDKQFNHIYDEAWDRGHSSGLSEVESHFDSIYDFVQGYLKL